jgi:two-component system, NarL family, response regulator LiaR
MAMLPMERLRQQIDSITRIPVPELPDSNPLKIAIFEDDPLIRLGLKQFLGAQPQLEVVGEAEDGYGAIECIRQQQIDLAIMDVGLPQLDGIEATRQIKLEFSQVRVLMLTSHEEETEIIAALSCGADGYCIKGTSLQQYIRDAILQWRGFANEQLRAKLTSLSNLP